MAYNIDQLLMNEAGRIGPEIFQKTINRSPWLKLVGQEAWPDQMGIEPSVLVYERSLANTLTWDAVGLNTGSGNNCVPSATVITPAQTTTSFNLKQTALESAPICVNDVRFSMNFMDQLRAVYKNLEQNVAYAWADRYRDEYIRLATHKMIASSTLTEDSAAFPIAEPTSQLTQGILDRVYMQLTHEGAEEGAYGMINGRPQYVLITSAEQSDNLIRVNSDTRSDYRYSTAVDELLQPLGIERAYRGFYHIVDNHVPRYNFAGGVFSRVRPYTTAAATNGTKSIVNPDYADASYEVSVVFVKDVFTSLIPKPITNPGGNVKFDPISYRGDFSWKNIADRTENPDGNIGYMRAVLSSGSKPIYPERGFAILHRRCDSPLALVGCS